MNIVLDGLLLAVPLMLALLGWSRGVQREGVTLIGALLGALLAEWVARPWAATNAQRYGQTADSFAVWAANGLILFCVIFIGYGGGLLLPSRRTIARGSARLFGMVLGAANGLFIEGLLLRSASSDGAALTERITATRIGPTLVTKLPQFLLMAVIVGAVLVVVRLVSTLLIRLHRGPEARKPAQKPGTAPGTRPGSAPGTRPAPMAPAFTSKPAPPKAPAPHTVADPILRDLLMHENKKDTRS